LSSNEAVKRLTPTFAEQCHNENSHFNFWSQLWKMLTDFQNSFTIDTREKNAVILCRWQRCPRKTFTYHYVVIQNIQFIQRMASSSLTQMISSCNAFQEMCVMLKVSLKCLPSAVMQSCAIPSLLCQSLADQDRLTLLLLLTRCRSSSTSLI